MHHSCKIEIFNILSLATISSASFRLMYNEHDSGGQILLTPTLALPVISSICVILSATSLEVHLLLLPCHHLHVQHVDAWHVAFQDRWTEIKIFERYKIKKFLTCKIELPRIWCHDTFCGPKYGIINAVGQAINVPKASPTNWISPKRSNRGATRLKSLLKKLVIGKKTSVDVDVQTGRAFGPIVEIFNTYL